MARLDPTLTVAGLEAANAIETPIASHSSLLCRWIVGLDALFV